MKALLANGRFRAALAAFVVVIVSHFTGNDLPVEGLKTALDFLATLILGAAIPSELFGAKRS